MPEVALYISIKTKFFVILAALMALILMVQFYFAYQAQQDLLKKLHQLSDRLNSAIDTHYETVLREIREKESDMQRIVDEQNDPLWVSSIVPAVPDCLYLDVVKELQDLRAIEKIKAEGIDKYLLVHPVPTVEIDPKHQKEMELIAEKYQDEIAKAQKLPDLSVIEKGNGTLIVRPPDADTGILPSIRYQKNRGSARLDIELIDVNINNLQQKIDTVLHGLRSIQSLSGRVQPAQTITIRVPDFSLPGAPKVVRYNFQTAELETAIQESFRRNILITTVLFSLSMLMIVFLSRRFLHPISHLKSSFEGVVKGNLNVNVPVKTRDEIGDLSSAFNQMVGELRKNREKEKLLQRKEHLASMGQLAAGVAHEIKNPLNAINLTIEHLRDRHLPGDQNALKYIHSIQNEIQRLDNLVNNFLNFVRSEHLEKADTDMNGLVSEVLQLLQQEIRSGKVEVETRYGEPFQALVDPERLKTVFLNIILNALHAMPEGGKLGILTIPERREIVIEDSGEGIPPDKLDNIFDLFYTTKSRGTGLGLPTAYKIIKEHGGEIVIQSETGKGTVVRVTL